MIWNHVWDPFKSHWGRSPLTAAVSTDDGDTWECYRNVEAEPRRGYSYPSIHFQGYFIYLNMKYVRALMPNRSAVGAGYLQVRRKHNSISKYETKAYVVHTAQDSRAAPVTLGDGVRGIGVSSLGLVL